MFLLKYIELNISSFKGGDKRFRHNSQRLGVDSSSQSSISSSSLVSKKNYKGYLMESFFKFFKVSGSSSLESGGVGKLRNFFKLSSSI